MRPRLLDLFCGAGGAAKGYADAGFDVVGVDVVKQPNYPFAFHERDVMDLDYATTYLSLHNDAGIAQGGQGEMCCYGPAKFEPERQFEPGGAPHVCRCSYDGPGTERYY